MNKNDIMKLTEYSQKRFIEVYSDADSFCFGSINMLGDDGFIINCISPHGNYDGYAAFLYDDIIKISSDTAYCEKMERIMHSKGADIAFDVMENVNDSAIDSLIRYAANVHKPVAIDIIDTDRDNMDAMGFIREYNTDTLILEEFDSYGAKNGYSLINRADICKLCCDDEDSVLAESLLNS